MMEFFKQKQIQELIDGAKKFEKMAALSLLLATPGLAEMIYTKYDYPKDPSFQANVKKRGGIEQAIEHRYEDRYGKLRRHLVEMDCALGTGVSLGLIAIAGIKYRVARRIAQRDD
jgi:hypothetical protein